MNYSNTIITDDNLQITLSKKYIETLYLSTNLYEHIEGEATAYDKHLLALNEFYNSLPPTYKYLGLSAGREWYELDNYRIGLITDFDIAMKAKWYTCVIQYKQSYMFSLPVNLNGLDLPFSPVPSKYHINRVDVTHIYRSSINYLNGYGIISSYRKLTTIEKNGKVETKYLGSRGNGNMVRWYNKTEELKSKEDYKKIELMGEYFNNIEDLYTIELELKRSYLKRCGIDTLEDIKKAYLLYKDIIGSVRVYRDTERNREHIRLKNYSRIDTIRFCEYEKFDRPKRVSKSLGHNHKYFLERFEKSYERYKDGLTFSKKIELVESLSNIIFGADMQNVDFSIGFEDCEEIREVNEMRERLEVVRAKQNNSLYSEGKGYFSD